MATQGRPIPAGTIRLLKMLRATLSVRETARRAGVDKNTVLKYTRRG